MIMKVVITAGRGIRKRKGEGVRQKRRRGGDAVN
jgi:hypothetical protein